jgi:hypothetical protein
METSYQQPMARPPIAQRPVTGTWGCIALAFASLVISVPADLFLMLVLSSSCSQPPDPQSVLQGRVAMLVVLLVAAVPWMIAVVMSRLSGRGALIGIVALLPALAFLLHAFTAGAWTGTLCLGG